MPEPRILVLRGGALGDFILTLPALADIRRHWPGAWVELVTRCPLALLAREAGLVDRTRSLDDAGCARLFADGAALPDDEAAWLRSFDRVLSYLHDPQGAVAGHLRAAGVGRMILASPIIAALPAALHLTQPLREWGVEADQAAEPRLTLNRARLQNGRRRAAAFGERVAVIHAGSGSPAKNWPIGNFLALADELARRGLASPIFTVGEADASVASELRTRACRFPVVSGLSVQELAELLSACTGYVGNDSGVTHLAAALGVPTVAVFGPTDPGVWAPRGLHVRVVAAPGGLAAIPVEAVLMRWSEVIPDSRAARAASGPDAA